MSHLCARQRDWYTKQLPVYACIFPIKALMALSENYETLCIVYVSLRPFAIERAPQGHQAFTAFSKPALRHGSVHNLLNR